MRRQDALLDELASGTGQCGSAWWAWTVERIPTALRESSTDDELRRLRSDPRVRAFSTTKAPHRRNAAGFDQ